MFRTPMPFSNHPRVCTSPPTRNSLIRRPLLVVVGIKIRQPGAEESPVPYSFDLGRAQEGLHPPTPGGDREGGGDVAR